MTDGVLEYVAVRAVADGQRAVDARNFDVAHDAVAGDIELSFVILQHVFRQVRSRAAVIQAVVEFSCGLQELFILLRIQICNGVRIFRNGTRLVQRIPVIADAGV